ncbi:hypothetical protein VSX64_16120 [Aurantimonas sp. C2-6-R+9]|uniref:hypothetical protein n=1 Tax=unclassified Aurantimonas TaxID=2638230 RepID=UPI002E17CBA2|nr:MULTISPECIES: hypothetical protein [unclassified Aurantimonas]MEC5291911.1 hypothetical protein [Aurantimonas sp. C2-3-R2]MEC5382390.1 hypothetical protein [Aurantimonas sp. C2-6-R+9]MEC5412997.1 hypothetical protein [Aurantimonas sp. C2-4-R8]
MSHNLPLARSHAFHLAQTLMVPVILFITEGAYGVLPADEFDGDEETILQAFDPFQLGLAH